MDTSTRAELDHLKTSLHDWALGDIKKTAGATAPIGAFILGAHFIDTLARLIAKKRKGRQAWDEFVPTYMPSYGAHAYLLYNGFRGATSHNYSARSIRFVDGEMNTLRHLTSEDGDLVLHLETFLEDLNAAWGRFYEAVESDAVLQKRVLERARENPPLGIAGGEPVQASVEIAPGYSLMIAGNNPTHFSAVSASAASWPTPLKPDNEREAERDK